MALWPMISLIFLCGGAEPDRTGMVAECDREPRRVVALPVRSTIMGLGIGAAVAVHEGSTLLVVFNALRLLAYRKEV